VHQLDIKVLNQLFYNVVYFEANYFFIIV